TGDNTSTRRGRHDQHLCTGHFDFSVVWNSIVCDRNSDHVLFSDISGFGNSCLHICALRNTDANFVFAVAHNNKCFKAEAATTFNDTCDTVDRDNDFFKLLRFLYTRCPTVTWSAATLLRTACWGVLARGSLRGSFSHTRTPILLYEQR